MRSVSGRGSQEAHSESQLLSSELPFPLQEGSLFQCQNVSFTIQQVLVAVPGRGTICTVSKDTDEGMSLAAGCINSTLPWEVSRSWMLSPCVCSRTSSKILCWCKQGGGGWKGTNILSCWKLLFITIWTGLSGGLSKQARIGGILFT